MNKDPKKKLILTIAAFVVAIGVIGYIYNYAGQTSVRTKKNYAKLLSESEILDVQISNTEKTNELLAKITDVQQAVPNILPPEKVQSDIVAQILADGENNGIFFDSINFPTSDGENFNLSQTEPLEGVSGVNKIGINISFTSSFGQMISFIEDIEKNRRISQIETINITPSGSDEDGVPSSDLAIGILLNLYVRG